MGFRFSVKEANWLAHILQPLGATPRLESEYAEQEALRQFIDRFESNFYTWRSERAEIPGTIRKLIDELNHERRYPEDILKPLREYFRDTRWIALLLPSGKNRRSDAMLTDRDFLRQLVDRQPYDSGLILQLEDAPENAVALTNVFPALRTALAQITRWPGVLVWTTPNDAAFFELTIDPSQIWERTNWLLDRLTRSYGTPNLEILKASFAREHTRGRQDSNMLRILHLSDLHLGSKTARRRLARVKALISTVIDELGEGAPIVPVITGDLMDTPTNENLAEVRDFNAFLTGLGIEEPIMILGNHDVRRDGWLKSALRQAVNIPRQPVVWRDDQSVAFACFNSANGGRLARGRIGESEFTNIGNELDKRGRLRNYDTIALVHHHPIPVTKPDWYKQEWYESILGSAFEETEALEDADLLLRWLESRRIPVVMHGHKHIPRFDKVGGLAVIGCGSTVGKVETEFPGQTYMSLNVVTLDRDKGMLGCRLRAERIPGGGLDKGVSHELVLVSNLQ